MAGYAADGDSTAAPVANGKNTLPPFHVVVDILNKEEVMAKKVGNWWGARHAANFMVSNEKFATIISEKLCTMMPEKLSEAAGIDLSMTENKNEKEGTHFVLDVQVLGFDLKVLGEKALDLDAEGGARFAGALETTFAALSKMGMSEKADDINNKIGNKVRNKIMEKLMDILPDKLAEEGVKIILAIPECQPSLEAAEAAESAERAAAAKDAAETAAMLGLGEAFEMRCVIEDRHALVDDIVEPGFGRGQLIKKFVANHIPDEKFNEVVGKKLQEKVPQALEEKAGIKASCERLKGTEKEGILVRMSVLSFDTRRLLEMAKGKEFADGYDSVITSLKNLSDLGLKGIDEKLDFLTAKVSGTVCDKVREKLAEVLAEKLHAKVTTA